MIITVLLYTLPFIILVQNNPQRVIASIIFVAIILAHDIFSFNLSDFSYYCSAAFFDFIIILLTSIINPVTKLVKRIHIICIFSIFINLLGYVIYVLNYSPLIYNLIFIGIYFWAILALAKKDEECVGNYTIDSIFSHFYCNSDKRHNYCHMHKS